MRLQKIQNLNRLKYCFNAFVLIFQRYLCNKGSKNNDYIYKRIEEINQKNFMHFGDFIFYMLKLGYK
jgi:hypothetical protein